MQEQLTYGQTKQIIVKKVVIKEVFRETVTFEEITVPSNAMLNVDYYPSTVSNTDSFNEKESNEASTIDDCEFRKEYAKLLDIKLPNADPEAFSQLYGTFDDLVTSSEPVDVTDWVKKIRRRK
jgi:hypothetical protein